MTRRLAVLILMAVTAACQQERPGGIAAEPLPSAKAGQSEVTVAELAPPAEPVAAPPAGGPASARAPVVVVRQDLPAPASTSLAAPTEARVVAAPVPRASAFSPQVANELGQAGVSTSPAGLRSLGATQGSLLGTVGRVVASPGLISALLNERMVVDAFMMRPDVQLFCEDDAALRHVLAYVLASAAARGWVQRQESVDALVDSKLAATFRRCPAFRRFAAKPGALVHLLPEGSSAARLIWHPHFREGLKRAKLDTLMDAAG